MAVVNPTTTISARSTDLGDRWDPTDDTTTGYVSGWPATIGAPSGQGAQGTREQVQWTLWCDQLVRLQHGHQVVDERTTDVYNVVWVAHVGGPLAHTKAGMNRQQGGAR